MISDQRFLKPCTWNSEIIIFPRNHAWGRFIFSGTGSCPLPRPSAASGASAWQPATRHLISMSAYPLSASAHPPHHLTPHYLTLPHSHAILRPGVHGPSQDLQAPHHRTRRGLSVTSTPPRAFHTRLLAEERVDREDDWRDPRAALLGRRRNLACRDARASTPSDGASR